MKTISLETSIKLNDIGILDKIETTFTYDQDGLVMTVPTSGSRFGFMLSDEYRERVKELGYGYKKKTLNVKTLTLEEAIEILQDNYYDKKRKSIFSLIYSDCDGNWSCDAGFRRSGNLIEVVEAELIEMFNLNINEGTL